MLSFDLYFRRRCYASTKKLLLLLHNMTLINIILATYNVTMNHIAVGALLQN